MDRVGLPKGRRGEERTGGRSEAGTVSLHVANAQTAPVTVARYHSLTLGLSAFPLPSHHCTSQGHSGFCASSQGLPLTAPPSLLLRKTYPTWGTDWHLCRDDSECCPINTSILKDNWHQPCHSYLNWAQWFGSRDLKWFGWYQGKQEKVSAWRHSENHCGDYRPSADAVICVRNCALKFGCADVLRTAVILYFPFLYLIIPRCSLSTLWSMWFKSHLNQFLR